MASPFFDPSTPLRSSRFALNTGAFESPVIGTRNLGIQSLFGDMGIPTTETSPGVFSPTPGRRYDATTGGMDALPLQAGNATPHGSEVAQLMAALSRSAGYGGPAMYGGNLGGRGFGANAAGLAAPLRRGLNLQRPDAYNFDLSQLLNLYKGGGELYGQDQSWAAKQQQLQHAIARAEAERNSAIGKDVGQLFGGQFGGGIGGMIGGAI